MRSTKAPTRKGPNQSRRVLDGKPNGTGQDRPFRVLSLDGGGIRGLYAASLLHHLACRFEDAQAMSRGTLDVGAAFDLIVGTSTGGIIACGLAFGLQPKQLIDLYRQCGPRIFREPIPQNYRFMPWLATHFRKAAHEPEPLATALQNVFEKETLGSVYERRRVALCIPAVNLRFMRSWVFKTPHDGERKRDAAYRLVDVCLATSAAPMYFPIACVDDPDGAGFYHPFVDGGLWANNPVMIALVEALELAEARPIQIVSISSCGGPKGELVDRSRSNWGVVDWRGGTKALLAALDSQSSHYTSMARKLAARVTARCDIVRLSPLGPGEGQLQHLGMDVATNPAIELLLAYGQAAASYYFGQAMGSPGRPRDWTGPARRGRTRRIDNGPSAGEWDVLRQVFEQKVGHHR